MNPRNILVFAEGQLGDLLLLTPALRAIKSGNPRSRLTVLIFQRRGSSPGHFSETAPVVPADPAGTGSVLLALPSVDRVMEVYRHRLKMLRGTRRLRAEWDILRWLRGERFDAVMCTFPEDRFAVLAFLSGAAIRVGQRRQGLWWLLNRAPDIRKSDGGVLKYYCALARRLGGGEGGEATAYALGQEERAWAQKVIAEKAPGARAVVAIHPGASGDYKIWPPERFASLADRLVDQGIAVLLCSGEGDADVVHEVVSHSRHAPAVIDTSGQLRRLGALFAGCALVITNDSGPRHLAIAVGAKTLALFRRHHDREWSVYPETPACRILRGEGACPACPHDVCADIVPSGSVFGSYCIRQISVESVAAAAEAMVSAS